MATAYIEDGYTEEGFIQEQTGIHEAVRFEFRPVLPGRMRSVLHQWSDLTGEEKTDRINNLIEDSLESWTLKHNGQILPINAEVLNRLKQPFVDRLFNIVTYADLGDKDAGEKKDQRETDEKN